MMKSELEIIPGVGKSIAQDLKQLGYETLSSLKGQNPQQMYERHCQQKGCAVDRCVLYVFRLAVYYAETPIPDPNKLQWWKWKD